MSDQAKRTEKLVDAITALEAQRGVLSDAVVDAAVHGLKQQLQGLETSPAQTALAAERKLVTVLFADISGFTALSEKLDPEEVRALINACFEALVPIVQKYEGTVDKFIGDEIMALFGAPVAHEDDPERALRTALEMMQTIATFNAAHQTALSLHMGVNSGQVIAGEIGSKGRRDYSVMGDAVNLAARLEGASSDGEIFVGANTQRHTAHLFEFEALPPLNLKGKEAPVDVYRLLGLKHTPKTARGIEGLRAPLVGREEELREIKVAVLELSRGAGGLIALMGEAGLGKSRLIAETRAALPENVGSAEGRALSYTAGMSYWLVRELLRDLLKIDADAPPTEVARALRDSVAAECGDRVADIYPYLAPLLDHELEGEMAERVQFLGAEALQSRMLEAFRDYVRARSCRQPLLLIWEDLHWSDPSSLRFLEALLPLTREVPLLLLGALRSDESPARQLLDGAFEKFAEPGRRFALRPLSPGQSMTLIRELLQLEDLPENMRDIILERADGNPFFVEELLRSLIEAGVVVLTGGRARVTREITAVDLPETIQGVVTARIDRLAPEPKQTLQKASVLGRVFQERVLERLHEGIAESRIMRSLVELERREFVLSGRELASETRALEEGDYIFKHAITQDVVYHSLLLAQRKVLHAAAAHALETLFPGRSDELAATLGYHFERAEAAPEAAHYLGRAGERAQGTFANAEALAFYRSALAQVERIDPAAQDAKTRRSAAHLNEKLGDVLTLTGEHGPARAAYERARSRLLDGEQIVRSRLHRKTGFSHNLQRHYDETGRAFDLAEKELGEVADGRPAEWWEEKVQIQLERMHLFYWQGMAAEMREIAARFRSAVEERGAPIQRGKFFQMLALSHLTASRYRPSEECLELAELSVSASEGSANLSEASHVRFVLGLIHLWRGNFAVAIGHAQAALALARRVGDRVIEARCLTYLAVAFRRAGQVEFARDYATRTLELASKLEMVEYVAMGHANLAWVAWCDDDHAGIAQHGAQALTLWHGMDDPYGFDWMALWPLAAVAFQQGRLGDMIEHLRALFGPNQHPLPDDLEAATRRAITAGERDREAAKTDLECALRAAREARQL
ncbi:MAG: AAA family ATPase [Chthoniobacterales bacterium]|nr:AAA family ATPase [Chthoniobacterales bacterium]